MAVRKKKRLKRWVRMVIGLFLIAFICLGIVAMRHFDPSFLRFETQEEPQGTYAVIYRKPLLGKQDAIRYDEEKKQFYAAEESGETLVRDAALIVSPDNTMFYEMRIDDKGNILKGWQETKDGRRYYDEETGWMAINSQEINGETYEFDEEGALISDTWKQTETAQYWYTGGQPAGSKEDALLYIEGEQGFYYLSKEQGGACLKNAETVLPDGRLLKYNADGKIETEAGMTSDGLYYFAVDEAQETAAKTRIVPVSQYSEESVHPIIKTVNHRGYHVQAPENSLKALEQSEQRGYLYVECDIQMTADNVPVLLHNSSINAVARNTDGSAIPNTRYVSDMTYEELCGYDFGIACGSEYAGLKITKLEEFLAYCRAKQIHPYLELKADTVNTQETVSALMALTEAYGMKDHVTWISFSLADLQYVLTADPEAETGMLVGNTDGLNSILSAVNDLRAQGYSIFMDVYEPLTGNVLAYCKNASIPLQVWTVNKENYMRTMDPYISGVTTDTLPADNTET